MRIIIIFTIFVCLNTPTANAAGGWDAISIGAAQGLGDGLQRKQQENDTQQLEDSLQQARTEAYKECLEDTSNLMPYKITDADDNAAECYNATMSEFKSTHPNSPIAWFINHETMSGSDTHKATAGEKQDFGPMISRETECSQIITTYAGAKTPSVLDFINEMKRSSKAQLTLMRKYANGEITRGDFWIGYVHDRDTNTKRLAEISEEMRAEKSKIYDQRDSTCRAEVMELQNQQEMAIYNAKVQAEIRQLQQENNAAMAAVTAAMWQQPISR